MSTTTVMAIPFDSIRNIYGYEIFTPPPPAKLHNRIVKTAYTNPERNTYGTRSK